LQERTGPTPAAPLLMNDYVRCAGCSWHASTHGFLQKMATWHMRDSRKIRHLADGAALLTCSPKTDPATMRVQSPESGRRRRTLDEEKTQPGADRPQATPGGGKAGCWSYGPGGSQGTRYKRSYLPPLEKPLWCDEHHRSASRSCLPRRSWT
jgi:hypothetical protein